MSTPSKKSSLAKTSPSPPLWPGPTKTIAPFAKSMEFSINHLLNSNPRCLYITETIGHGSNIVTGDYSVGANGFLIENGEFKYPINEVTIAGNFIDIFKNISLANDLEFKYATNSPTMMIEGMVVAGK